MHAVEEAGLLKYDFLGLKNLTIIHETMRRLRKTRDVVFDLQTIPLNDKAAFRMLAEGKTYGIFQMASEGMTKWLKELKPTTIHDINAMVALYRPGPMDFIPEYIARKENPMKVKYPDPRMKEFLEDSLGLMIYQEDVMLIAVNIAGYSWLEADKFRKAMGKKIPEVMAKEEEKFTTGCIASGMNKKVVDKLWEDITKFAAYGFNKSHAASYGRVAYQTAYLKANYPSEYMAALLSADSGDNERIAKAVEESRAMGLKVLPPDVNASFEDFGVAVGETRKEDTIRFGLKTIKNFGDNLAVVIVEERKANGKYQSLEDFLRRVNGRDLNKKSLEALALAGGLDSLEDRSLVVGNLDDLLGFAKSQREQNKDQDSLFSMMGEDTTQSHLQLSDVTGGHIRVKTTGMEHEIISQLPLSKKDKLFWEKQLLGLYVSGHPLEKDKAKIIQLGLDIKTTKMAASGMRKVIGIVDVIKEIQTKKGDTMAFVQISDFSDSIELVVFPDSYKEYKELLSGDSILQVKGKLNRRDGQLSILFDSCKKLK
jgi:DNA polymerase-3 subunit alpha